MTVPEGAVLFFQKIPNSCPKAFHAFRHRFDNPFSIPKHTNMKDFMFVFRGPTPEDLKLKALKESQASMQKWFDWIRQLSEQGRYKGGELFFPG